VGRAFESGVDAVGGGVAMGLLGSAYPAGRGDRSAPPICSGCSASSRPRSSRVRRASVSRRRSAAPIPSLNRLRDRAAVRARQRGHSHQRRIPVPRLHLPITLGILLGYVVGKPVGITGASWLLTRLSRGRLRAPVGWAKVAGGGSIAGIASAPATGRPKATLRATSANGARRKPPPPPPTTPAAPIAITLPPTRRPSDTRPSSRDIGNPWLGRRWPHQNRQPGRIPSPGIQRAVGLRRLL
jgi:Na+/H+ antiporter 1